MRHLTQTERTHEATMDALRRAMPRNGGGISVREDVLDRVVDGLLRDVQAAEAGGGRDVPAATRRPGFDDDVFDGHGPADCMSGELGGGR